MAEWPSSLALIEIALNVSLKDQKYEITQMHVALYAFVELDFA